MITNSQFYRDSELFFPEDTVADPRGVPPPLTSLQRAALEADLNKQLNAVCKLAKMPALMKLLGELTPLPGQTRVVLTNFNAPEASTAEDGEISIDARVVQALLRSALVTQYRTEIELERLKADRPRSDPFTADEERLAINTFLAARAHVRDAKGASMIGDVASWPEDASDDDAMDPLGLSLSSRNLSGLDVRYDSELLFLIAHEVGHLALGHYGPNPKVIEFEGVEDECAARRGKEAAADIYATSLVALGTPGNAAYELFGSLMEAGTTVGDGFDTFFQYAYDYAGFTSGGSECHNYPPPAERLEVMQRLHQAIRKGQTDAILQSTEKR